MFIITYDISNEKRLKNIAKICESYLIRVQKSVFEGDLTKSQLHILQEKLTKTMDKEEDSIIIYFVARASFKRKKAYGKNVEDPYLII
ncbi:MAG: CRISPR-associated endonuclease Cas2 [Candidatus Lokiarchaeota archaeon]|nr:CRISPR-associated endonuclease Cas2 [Candidatus Lokiarchaeota archaeon]MBD3342643.1 CRISPR-associated endonuclease Cas2 [Candidatus Lokiarchaeota archaeon]